MSKINFGLLSFICSTLFLGALVLSVHGFFNTYDNRVFIAPIIAVVCAALAFYFNRLSQQYERQNQKARRLSSLGITLTVPTLLLVLFVLFSAFIHFGSGIYGG